MEENEREIEPSTTTVRFFNIPVEDANMIAEIIRQHGRKGNVALRAMLDSYGISRTLNVIMVKIDGIEQRLQEIENKDKNVIKTMGGNKIEVSK